MQKKIIIKGVLTDLNQFIKEIARNRYVGGKIKKEETERVYWECKEQKIKPITKFPIKIIYNWYSKNKRKDIDNVAFSKKFINDGLVMAEIIPDDSRKYIKGFSDNFFIDKDFPRVELTLEEKENEIKP